ncbi:ALQxL family class IV lanthipeptide [Nonomuraea pusilla]|nr:ALQxL family class IV lanthipeptide [Nonomuraea pusilla]
MSFDVQDLQALPETEPAARESVRLTNCSTTSLCTDA